MGSVHFPGATSDGLNFRDVWKRQGSLELMAELLRLAPRPWPRGVVPNGRLWISMGEVMNLKGAVVGYPGCFFGYFAWNPKAKHL